MTLDRDRLKRAAALRALDYIVPGMIVGLGTGSTAAFVVKGLAERVARGLEITGIPTSERTASMARDLGIPLSSLAEHQRIDLTIDGADEVERGSLNLIKGLGGALLREKIVASVSERLVIVVDREKLVDRLGERSPVPVETVPARLAGDRLGARRARCRAGTAPGRGQAVRHRRRQLHRRLQIRRHRRSAPPGAADRDDRRRGRKRVVHRPRHRGGRRLHGRGRGAGRRGREAS